MNKKNQTEEMARLMCQGCANHGDCKYDICDATLDEAKRLFDAGFRRIVTCDECVYCNLMYPIKEVGKDAEEKCFCKARQAMVDPDGFCAKGRPKHQPNNSASFSDDEGAECPTCHGTGRIGTSDWLTRDISKKQLAREKEEAIAEFHTCIKNEGAKEAILKIDEMLHQHSTGDIDDKELYRLFGDFKKKIVEEK